MVTRLYLGRGSETAPIAPNPSTSWEDSTLSSVFPNPILLKKKTRAMTYTDVSFVTNSISNRDILLKRYNCELAAGQIISANQTIKIQCRGKTNSVAGLNTETLAFGVRIVAANGTDVRRTLVDVQGIGSQLSRSTLTNAGGSVVSTNTQYETVAGDCLVVEIGFNQNAGID